jgi:hypothetical protein
MKVIKIQFSEDKEDSVIPEKELIKEINCQDKKICETLDFKLLFVKGY